MSCSEHHPIIRVITEGEDGAKPGFISTYIDVFAGDPYFEHFEPEYVDENVWVPHLLHCILVAERPGDAVVVGLACCHPVLADTEPAVRDYLASQPELPFDVEKTVFMSELAVRTEGRGNGLGTELVLERLRWARDAGYTHYAMRTASDGSKSERLYVRLGAHRAPFVQDVSGADIESASSHRIYLWGEIETALANG